MEKEPKWKLDFRMQQEKAAIGLALRRQTLSELQAQAVRFLSYSAQQLQNQSKEELIHWLLDDWEKEKEKSQKFYHKSHNHSARLRSWEGHLAVIDGEMAKDERADVVTVRDGRCKVWRGFKRFDPGLTNEPNFMANFKQQVAHVSAATAFIYHCSTSETACMEKGELPSISELLFEKTQKHYIDNYIHQKTLGGGGTAFLVGKNYMLTAAHNLRKNGQDKPLESLRFIFGFQIDEEEKTPILEAEKSYEAESVQFGKGLQDDWALVKLKKVVKGRSPLKLSNTVGQPGQKGLYLIGHPLGLPMKICLVGGFVHPLNSSSFLVSHDAYMGNSGSPVLNMQGEVEGILVAGSHDFEVDGDSIFPRKYSYRMIVDGHAGERCQNISSIRPHLPESILKSNF